MTIIAAEIASRKRIALVAHDNKKHDLLEWARYNRDLLSHHALLATGTTGKLLESARAAAARSRCQGVDPDCGGVEYSGGLQPGHRRFRDFVAADVVVVSA